MFCTIFNFQTRSNTGVAARHPIIDAQHTAAKIFFFMVKTSLNIL